MILAGDIGATKTHVALFDSPRRKKIVREEIFKSRDHETLSDILKLFLGKGEEAIEWASFGVAGPVEEGRCRATNLAWVVDSRELAEDLKLKKVFLINDLEANAYGLRALGPKELFILNPGKKQTGHGALIAAGTGLGEAGLFWNGKEFIPIPSEGGHSDFSPRDDLEIELWHDLRNRFGHVSFERVLSGPGIYNLYRFLIDSGKEKESPEVKKLLEKELQPKVITEAALKKSCKACMRTLTWFVSLYGGEAGNLALKFLALGGVYIGGGIAPKILPYLKEGPFMQAFCAKGRFSALLSSMPVRIVLNENTALLGALEYAVAMGSQEEKFRSTG